MIQLQYFGLASFGANLFLIFNLCIRLGYPNLRMLFLFLFLFLWSVFIFSFGVRAKNNQKVFCWANGLMLVAAIGGILAWI